MSKSDVNFVCVLFMWFLRGVAGNILRYFIDTDGKLIHENPQNILKLIKIHLKN